MLRQAGSEVSLREAFVFPDPDLAAVIVAWVGLLAAMRAGIVLMALDPSRTG